MNGHPDDPNFTGVKQPAFDYLVSSHAKAAPALDRLAGELWTQLRRMGADTSSALRIRTLAGVVGSQVTELNERQQKVRDMQQREGGTPAGPGGALWVKLPDDTGLSHELAEAYALPPPYLDPNGPQFTRQESAVLSWIQANRHIILREAKRRDIPPEAIIAAIAWEAMENVKPRWPLGPRLPYIGRRSIGPGKVHIDESLVLQLEQAGYLPARSTENRQAMLDTREGSIIYIAAIMDAFADVADRDGRYNIRGDVSMLTQLFQGSDLEKWKRDLAAKQGGPFRPENPMAQWVLANPEFLKAAMRPPPPGWTPPSLPPESLPPVQPPLPPSPTPGTSPTPPPPPPPPPSAPRPTPGTSPTPP